MTSPILVTGGTGTLGRHVVHRLVDPAREVRVLSRRSRPTQAPPGVTWVTGDLVSGAGVAGAVAGAEAVIHCASDPRRPRSDAEGTRNLIDAARAMRAPHLIYISIVGADRVPLGYYRAKLDGERLVENSGLPWTILRATQFHDLLLRLAEALTRLPVMPVPAGTSFQPVDAREVAARLVEIATGKPGGRAAAMGCPQVRTAASLARAYLTVCGRRRPMVPILVPGAVFAGYRHGGHLAPACASGRLTWEEFLAERVGRRRCPGPVGRTTPAGS